MSDKLSLGTIVYLLVYLWIFAAGDKYSCVPNFNLVKNALFFFLYVYCFYLEEQGFSQNDFISLIFIMPLLFLIYKGSIRHLCRFILILYCALLLTRNLSSYNIQENKLQFLPYKTMLF